MSLEMPKELLRRLKPFEQSYINNLNTALDKILDSEIRLTNEPSTTPARLETDSAGEKKSSVNRFLELFFDFNNAIRHIHSIITDESGDRSHKMNLSDLVRWFNAKLETNISLERRVIEVLDTGRNIVSDTNANLNAQSILEEYKVDLRKYTNELYHYFVTTSILKLDFQFKIAKQSGNNILDYIIHETLPLGVKYLLKIRKGPISDLSDFAAEAIEQWKQYNNGDRKVAVMLIIFSDQNAETFSTIRFNFNRIIEQLSGHHEATIKCVPAVINSLKTLEDSLNNEIEAYTGLKIGFNFDGNLSSHGWRVPTNLIRDPSVFTKKADPQFGRYLQSRIIRIDGHNLIDYPITAIESELYRNVAFYARPTPQSMMYVQLSVKDNEKEFWFQIKEGDGEPTLVEENKPYEYIVYLQPKPFLKWKVFHLDINHYFPKTFGQMGLTLDRIVGIRLRGQFEITRIQVF